MRDRCRFGVALPDGGSQRSKTTLLPLGRIDETQQSSPKHGNCVHNLVVVAVSIKLRKSCKFYFNNCVIDTTVNLNLDILRTVSII